MLGLGARLLAHVLDFGALVAQEAHGVPVLTVVLSPAVLRSLHHTPTYQAALDPNHFPGWAKRALFWLVDTRMVDSLALPALNGLRAEAGLGPVRRPMV